MQDPKETLHYLHGTLLRPRAHIQNDPWAGLPELTNRNGSFCKDSCPTQAWSMSTLLDFLQDSARSHQYYVNTSPAALLDMVVQALEYVTGKSSAHAMMRLPKMLIVRRSSSRTKS